MTPRSVRRAAERQAVKDARKTDHLTAPPSEPRLAANAANAQLSTGPRTIEGKAKSSINAVKTALTGRTVLLPSDDVAAYHRHVQNYTDEFQPVGPLESELAQALADHAWRLDRITSLEMAIYAYGHEQFAELFADRGAMQAGFTEMHTFLHYEKQLRNLQIQEMRIRRNREKDTAELRRLQQARAANQSANQIENQAVEAHPEREPASGACAVGFDFSFSECLDAPYVPDAGRTLSASEGRSPREHQV